MKFHITKKIVFQVWIDKTDKYSAFSLSRHDDVMRLLLKEDWAFHFEIKSFKMVLRKIATFDNYEQKSYNKFMKK